MERIQRPRAPGMPTKTAEVFEVLKQFAKEQRTVTYKKVGEQTGLHPRQVSLRLYSIWQWCENRSMPHLSAIAVNKATGMPGKGYQPFGQPVTPEEFRSIRDKVFGYNWDPVAFP